MIKLALTVLRKHYAICKIQAESVLPVWTDESEFCVITRTPDGLSIVCRQDLIPDGLADINRDWRILKIEGPLDFSLVGILAEILEILKEKNISIFAISTYDTDYILVKNNKLEQAIKALTISGYNVTIK